MSEFLAIQPLFRPDLVEMPSAEHITEMERLAREGRLGAAPPFKELPVGSRGIRLQLTALQVMEGLQGLLGRPTAAGIYVITSVTDGIGEQPITFQGKVYQGIRHGDLLPLGPAHESTSVFTVYVREGQMPRVLSFSLLVLRSNESLRHIGRVLTQTTRDERFSKLSEVVGNAVGSVNPAYGMVWQAADEAMSLVGSYLEAKADDQLGYYQANYTNLFDDLGLGKHPADRPTMVADKIRLAYEVNVA